MYRNNGFGLLGIVVVIFIILILGGGLFYASSVYKKGLEEGSKNGIENETLLERIGGIKELVNKGEKEQESVGWVLYENKQYKFGFQYPAELALNQKGVGSLGDVLTGTQYQAELYRNIVVFESSDFLEAKSGWRVVVKGPLTLLNGEDWEMVVREQLYPYGGLIEGTSGINSTLVLAGNPGDLTLSKVVYATNAEKTRIVQFELQTFSADRARNESYFDRMVSSLTWGN